MRRTKMFFAVALATAMITGSAVGVTARPSITTEAVLSEAGVGSTTVEAITDISASTKLSTEAKATFSALAETKTTADYLDVAADNAVDTATEEALAELKEAKTELINKDVVELTTTEAGVFTVKISKDVVGNGYLYFSSVDADGKVKLYEVSYDAETEEATIETDEETDTLTGDILKSDTKVEIKTAE